MFAPPTTQPPTLPTMPPVPKAIVTQLTPMAQALLLEPWDPFSKAQHEAKMNAWLMAQTEMANAHKVEIYVQAWKDWAENAQRYADLHMPVPPPPMQPVLDRVGPMPVGYWFGQ